MHPPIKPPAVNIDDKELKTIVELIIYQYDLRCLVTKLRSDLGLPENGLALTNHTLEMEAFKLAEFSAWHANHNDTIRPISIFQYKEIRKAAGGLSPFWNDFINYLVFFNDASHPPRSNEEIKNSVAASLTGAYDLLETRFTPQLDVRIFQKISKTQWAAIYEEVKKKWSYLPDRAGWNTASVKKHSLIADMRRSGKSTREIASKFPELSETSIRQIISRAKVHGL